MKEFFKKNWLVILVGCLSAFLGVLTLLTVTKLKRPTPLAPTVPQAKPKAVTPASTLTFKLALRLSPTPTETPTSSPTSIPNEPPICTGLSANPTSGNLPLEVTFTGNGVDQDGKISAFEFSFGDGKIKLVEKDVAGLASHSLTYTYSLPGTYWASLRVKDNNNLWSEVTENCKVKIEVSKVMGKAQTPTATSTPIPVPQVPEAGVFLPTILTILSGSLLILLGVLL